MSPYLIQTDEWIIVTFDFYASESLLNELAKSDKLDHLVDFLDEIRSAMVSFESKDHWALKTPRIEFKRYKFTGDGWILLFPRSTKGDDILAVIFWIARTFWHQFVTELQNHLSRPLDRVGIRFGVERGVLKRVWWDGREEFVGPALMIADRLQNALKLKAGRSKIAKGRNPFSAWTRILVKRRCFESLFSERNPLRMYSPRDVLISLNKDGKGRRVKCVEMDIQSLDWPHLLKNFPRGPEEPNT